MAKPIVPRRPAHLYIVEWLAIRGMSRVDLAAALETTEASVSRYINNRRGVSLPIQRAMEEALMLPPGGLRRAPDEAGEDALLAGLDGPMRKDVLKYIEFVRKRGGGR